MKKKYQHPEENKEENKEETQLNEPVAEYATQTKLIPSPPLTEEELKNAITGDELVEAVTKHIHELFNKK